MSLQVLILYPVSPNASLLESYFHDFGDEAFIASSAAEAQAFLKTGEPELVVVNIHHFDDTWQPIVENIRKQYPTAKFLFAVNYPDPPHEQKIKSLFEDAVLLYAPFTRAGLEQAILEIEGRSPIVDEIHPHTTTPPKVRIPVRMKITLPYLILALFLAIGAGYVLSQVVLDTIEERFTNQLIEAGKLANDWLVNEEDRLLGTERLVVNTRGLANAVAAEDAETLREIVLPIAINYQEESIEILNNQGISIISMRHKPGGNLEEYFFARGDNLYSQWPFVDAVLQQRVDARGDKFAGLAIAPWGSYLYIAGPVYNASGQRVGVVLVGKTLKTIVSQIRQDTLAQVSLYDLNGHTLASTFQAFESNPLSLDAQMLTNVAANKSTESLIHPIQLGSIKYSELIGPFEIRPSMQAPSANQNGAIAFVGTALAETFLVHPSQITRVQVFLLTAFALALIVIMGFYLANRITRPLLDVVNASSKVANGNLDIHVKPSGNDEVAVLAHSFNEMVMGLREGSIYRDLLGRTVSPEVRDELRQEFASGTVNLAGQEMVATVLVSDIRGFTTLAETETPTIIMSWLNEFFEEMVPVVSHYGGIISKFEGDAILAFFGILPRPLSAQESAYRACKTALALIDTVSALNERRAKRHEPQLDIGIGINTGPVTAGALGSNDRLQYTIIGDTVNTTARLESLTRQFGEGNIAVISQHTLFALRELRHEFAIESLGVHNVKGKMEQLLVFQLQSAKVQEAQ